MIDKIDISKIKVNPSNPRLIKDDKFDKLVQSIKDFPKMLKIRPIVVNSEMIVLGGNMRLQACKKAGLKEVYIIKADDLTEKQQQEFIIKDNIGFGQWDWDILANEWEKEELTEWGLDTPDDWIVDEPEVEEDNYEIPDEIETDIVLGDLIEIGEHRLLCGDSTDSEQVAKLMNGKKADMVFTDPPFPNNSAIMHDMIIDIDKAFINARRYCDNLMIWFWDNIAFPSFNEMATTKHIWHKTNGWQAGHFETMYGYHNDNKRHEQLVFNANSVGINNKRETQGFHLTPKPIELPVLIFDKLKFKKSVLDLFLGSGSTLIACEKTNRKCYGMELDPKYCQVIIDRMQKLDPSLSIKVNGKDYGRD